VIAWDHNAGAPLLPDVAAHLAQALAQSWGNPSSVHQVGRRARHRLDGARERVAKALGAASPREIIFTGSGSEAAALAIIGAYRARRDRAKTRVVTTAIEHPCVLGAVAQLEHEGATVVRLAPGPSGAVAFEQVAAALSDDTLLCSVMAVNNETGVVQPAGAIARECTRRGVLFHCDAVQAFGRLPMSLREVPADLLSFSAHKLGGPAGVGVLYDRRAVEVAALTPGHQENGRRGGTQSVAFAEAAAMALEHALATQATSQARVTALRDDFERQLLQRLPSAVINGASAARVGNTSNVRFESVDGEALLIALDLAGVCVSTGAACASGSLSPSHVLLAMGLSAAEAHGTLRFSLGAEATQAEVDAVLTALELAVPACRENLPR
jgi:cysteine desulfurase